MNTSNTFFGHPIGLKTLFLTEMWERMSYYGMRALLVLYMTGAVTGFNPGLGWSQIDAQAIYGIYVGMVYFMVVPGGWIADNILGHQKAVLIGAFIIALGHFTLAIPIEQSFFLGLTFVVLGTGLLKGNISTIVGELYKNLDEKRDSGYTIFYMSINIGSTLGFLVCAYLGEKIGWHWGFGAAGIGMAFGVIQFLRSKDLLGDAGMHPNEMSVEKRSKLSKYMYASLVGMFVIIGAGLMGLITIDPRVFAENFAYFLTIVAGVYFVYLFFAIAIGLGYAAGQVLVTTVIVTLIMVMIYFWLSNRDIARTLEYNMIITWTKKELKFNDIINNISDFVNSVKLIRLDHHSSNHKAVLLVSPKENYSPDDLIEDLMDLDDALKVSFYESKTKW